MAKEKKTHHIRKGFMPNNQLQCKQNQGKYSVKDNQIARDYNKM